MRIAFISNHPAPYRDAFLGKLVHEPGIETDVFSLFPYDSGHKFWDLKDQPYRAEVLCPNHGTRLSICWKLLRRFLFARYDMIVWPGYFAWYLSVPLFLSAMLGRRYAFCADSVAQPAIGRFARFVKRTIVRRAAFVFVPGKASRDFFMREFGLPEDKICLGTYALDGEELKRQIMGIDRATARRKFGINPDATVFLMVANMIPTRHYPITVQGFRDFAKRHGNSVFVIVGKGADLPAMEAIAQADSCIRVIPGCAFEEMKSLYAAADVYVHGGKEPASTALVIGAISHLPLISSRAVGCSADVLEDGVTGIEVKDYLNAAEWTAAFEQMLEKQETWGAMGTAARRASQSLDLEVCYKEFVKKLYR